MPLQAIRHHATPLPPPPWQDLLARIARRDQTSLAALAALYDQTHRAVFGLLLTLLPERASAETVLLEVYEEVWRQPVNTGAAPLPWLMFLARQRALAKLPQRPTAPPRRAAAAPAVTALRQQARGALLRLPLEQRRALELACFEGLNYSEIAARLGHAPDAVRASLAAGMRTLRAHLPPSA